MIICGFIHEDQLQGSGFILSGREIMNIQKSLQHSGRQIVKNIYKEENIYFGDAILSNFFLGICVLIKIQF